jgi:hypothetical protein
MLRFESIPRRILLTLACLYASVSISFAVIHVYQLGVAKSGDPGLEVKYSQADCFCEVVSLLPDGPAERAGLRIGDRIAALNGGPVGPLSFYELRLSTPAGETVQFTIERSGGDGVIMLPLTLRVVLPPRMFSHAAGGQRFVLFFLQVYPLLYLAVGLTVLFLRVDSAAAWLLALVFAGFLAGGLVFAEELAGFKPFEGFIRPFWLRGALVCFEIGIWISLPALFNYFFATFPNRSPLDRWMPWLKQALLAVGMFYAVWLGTSRLGNHAFRFGGGSLVTLASG